MLYLTCSFVEEYDPTIGKFLLLLLMSPCFVHKFSIFTHADGSHGVP